MSDFLRYAIYWLPQGDLSRWGQGWLGWDMAAGRPLPRPQVDGLPRDIETITAPATVYGLHATVKAPFRLAAGADPAGLNAALADFCAARVPVACDGLELAVIDGFIALLPCGDTTALDAMAGDAVAALDHFRAPAPEAEIARRRAAGLTARQDANLLRWGYPYAMQDFRFHVTLTGRLAPDEQRATLAAITPTVAPLLPQPLVIDGLALVGQGAERFRLIAHHGFAR